jgi:hypothetical protein
MNYGIFYSLNLPTFFATAASHICQSNLVQALCKHQYKYGSNSNKILQDLCHSGKCLLGAVQGESKSVQLRHVISKFSLDHALGESVRAENVIEQYVILLAPRARLVVTLHERKVSKVSLGVKY